MTVFANPDCISPLQDKISGKASDEITTPLARHREIVVGAGANCAGKLVRELDLPPDIILVSIRRGDETIVPHGNTAILPGDIVEIFGHEEEICAIEPCFAPKETA